MKSGKLWDWQFLGIFVIIAFTIYVFVFFIQVSGRECIKDSDCPSANYCGSDYSCHAMPAASQKIIQSQFPVASALIVGLAVIIVAFIVRKS